jgi:hypothetical protein
VSRIFQLATFNSLGSAEALSGFLNSYGIFAQVQTDRDLLRWWNIRTRSAGVHVSILREQLLQAERLLTLNPSAARLLKDAVRCAGCGSYQIHHPRVSPAGVLPRLVIQTGAAAGLFEQNHYCEKCHQMPLAYPHSKVRRASH